MLWSKWARSGRLVTRTHQIGSPLLVVPADLLDLRIMNDDPTVAEHARLDRRNPRHRPGRGVGMAHQAADLLCPGVDAMTERDRLPGAKVPRIERRGSNGQHADDHNADGQNPLRSRLVASRCHRLSDCGPSTRTIEYPASSARDPDDFRRAERERLVQGRHDQPPAFEPHRDQNQSGHDSNIRTAALAATGQKQHQRSQIEQWPAGQC